MNYGEMLEVLTRAETMLSNGLLHDADGWHTLDVDYEPPRVERLWREFGNDYRLYLHRISPCKNALYHPHPWPSAVKILCGEYEMGLGYELDPVSTPPYAATLVLTAGARYEMIDIRGWHYVRPKGPSPVYSIMVTGPAWERWSPKAKHKLGPLDARTKAEVLGSFREFYAR